MRIHEKDNHCRVALTVVFHSLLTADCSSRYSHSIISAWNLTTLNINPITKFESILERDSKASVKALSLTYIQETRKDKPKHEVYQSFRNCQKKKFTTQIQNRPMHGCGKKYRARVKSVSVNAHTCTKKTASLRFFLWSQNWVLTFLFGSFLQFRTFGWNFQHQPRFGLF